MQVQREWLFHPHTLTGPWFQTARATTCGKTVALQEFPLCPHARSVCGREDILCTGILSNTKNKETKQKQEKPFSKTARRDGTYDNHGVTATAHRCRDADAKNLSKFTMKLSLNMFNWCQNNLSWQLYSINKTSRLLQSDSRNPNLSRLRSENTTTKVTRASPEPLPLPVSTTCNIIRKPAFGRQKRKPDRSSRHMTDCFFSCRRDHQSADLQFTNQFFVP